MAKQYKAVDSLKAFMKEANIQPKKDMIKSAAEQELYNQGVIFGKGMAEGFLTKIAEEIEQELQEVQEQPAAVGGVPAPEAPTVAPQQVPAEPSSDELAQLKEYFRQLTPVQLAQWLLQQPPEIIDVIDQDAELSSMAQEALAVFEKELENMPVPPEVADSVDNVESKLQ